jgi:hypothetical protein
MEKKLTDGTVPVKTAVVAGDLMYGVRPSLGSAGGYAITVEN